MDLYEELRAIKLSKVYEECFKGRFYNVTPLSELYKGCKIPELIPLREAHCINFSDMTEEMVEELKRLTKHVIDNREELLEANYKKQIELFEKAFKKSRHTPETSGKILSVTPEKTPWWKFW